jgi:hypothetical protein
MASAPETRRETTTLLGVLGNVVQIRTACKGGETQSGIETMSVQRWDGTGGRSHEEEAMPFALLSVQCPSFPGSFTESAH